MLKWCDVPGCNFLAKYMVEIPSSNLKLKKFSCITHLCFFTNGEVGKIVYLNLREKDKEN